MTQPLGAKVGAGSDVQSYHARRLQFVVDRHRRAFEKAHCVRHKLTR